MTELLNLQSQFQKFLLTGHSDIKNSIEQTERVLIDTRLGIYRDAYKLRLIESLTTSYPALHAYLGTEEFNKLCSSYIDAHPSTYRSIRWYGDALADFVQHYYDKPYAYLAELADFEWKMTLAFDAADDQVLRIQDMGNVPAESWAGLQFTLHPSVQRLNYFWNAIPVWHTLINDQDLPEWNKSANAVSWVVWRTQDYLIQYYSLSEEEAWALDAVRQGLSFGELCEGLCHWVAVDEVGMRAASFLKSWIQNGILSHLLSSD
ncbi:HvfC/BufC N-terminal domain-containing protein [Legionella bononiensis]|uniref:DNA-binding domain-containing protein n=1 Tax=Legionella bononiensis TaxID=2793102 RepID=A0ABS1WAC5_9GAMM|nr:putative DNA-binding domain-containing protein [Legionella bononiensis]MBL7480453.1 putative DNA-binding domain-containing protein [Legionella bononiensis]MBL7526312.1 putative DNA-binding domain-containing protein [Legionella bononiensis]MBL7563193.1 putative DNA-binding domain-containing protein [Legionella bononiensis]